MIDNFQGNSFKIIQFICNSSVIYAAEPVVHVLQPINYYSNQFSYIKLIKQSPIICTAVIQLTFAVTIEVIVKLIIYYYSNQVVSSRIFLA